MNVFIGLIGVAMLVLVVMVILPKTPCFHRYRIMGINKY